MKKQLDPHTFGSAPAAIYLTLILNKQDEPLVTRKVSRIINESRKLLNDVVDSHYYSDHMSTSSFAKLLFIIENNIRESVFILADKHLQDLVINVLVGEIKTYKNRTQRAARIKPCVDRLTPEGQSPMMIKAVPGKNEQTRAQRVEWLRQKSREYLDRKGKINTLY